MPFKLQYWGVRQNLCPAFTACCASCLHTKHEQLPHTMSRMWEPNHCLGTSSPCRAISKTCLGRKRGHRSVRFQLACALRSKQPVSCSTHTLRYIHGDVAPARSYSGRKEHRYVLHLGKSRNAAVTAHAAKTALDTNQPLQILALSSSYRKRKY